MHRLRVRNVGIDTAMPFESTLTNAVPGPNPIITVDPKPFQPYKDKPTALEK